MDGATLIAGVLEGLEPIPGSGDALASVDRAAFTAAGFEGKDGEVIALSHPEAAALIVMGLGDEISYESIRTVSAEAIRRVKTERAVTFLAAVDIEGATQAVAEGSLLGGYQFLPYKTDTNGSVVDILDIVDADQEALGDAGIVAEATMLARDWVNTPAKDKAPETLADLMARATDGTTAEPEIWDRPRIESEKLGGLLGVAAGSDRDPRVVFVRYRPANATRHLALVGKGITFDSGGLSLKTRTAMEEMKYDMAGAAAVVAATIAISRLEVPLSVTAIAPLTDNVVGGDATRPGDILRPVDGPTVEVLNTDAEGRLILADALGLAKRLEPDLTIDVATLTGSAVIALGKQLAAVFGSDTDVTRRVLEAASRAGEGFWELPLHKGYRKTLESNIADIKNSYGTRYGTAILAALFLAEYAGEGPWAHLDIAGPAMSPETNGEVVKGGSGFSVRTLVEVARGMIPPA